VDEKTIETKEPTFDESGNITNDAITLHSYLLSLTEKPLEKSLLDIQLEYIQKADLNGRFDK
jgi:hypothetical protein